jgi:hypothetical protein
MGDPMRNAESRKKQGSKRRDNDFEITVCFIVAGQWSGVR